MSLDVSQVIIQIIAFLIMLWVLKKFGWKPLLSILHERQQKIQSEFDAIAAQKEDIQKLADNYQAKLGGIEAEARHQIQEAIMQGRKIALEIQSGAQANARDVIAKARTEMEKEVEKARNQLKNDVVKISVAIAEKIIKEKLNESEHKKLTTEFIEEAELK